MQRLLQAKGFRPKSVVSYEHMFDYKSDTLTELIGNAIDGLVDLATLGEYRYDDDENLGCWSYIRCANDVKPVHPYGKTETRPATIRAF